MTRFRWLVEVTKSNLSERVLYAIPHAGAGASAVKVMCRELADVLDSVAVRLPGRESLVSEEPLTDMEVLGELLAPQVADFAGQRRILLYGHCAGAVVAYEVARRLSPRQIDFLIVSAQEAPDRIPAPGTWKLPGETFFAQVASDGYFPAEILRDPDLLELVEPALRADYQAVESYRGGITDLKVPVVALRGAQDRLVSEDDMAAWGQVTSVGFRLETIAGGHNLLSDAAAGVAEVIRNLAVNEGSASRAGIGGDGAAQGS